MSTNKIEKLKIKLNKSIEKYGLDSEKVKIISEELDNIINNYYKRELQYPERKYYKRDIYIINW